MTGRPRRSLSRRIWSGAELSAKSGAGTPAGRIAAAALAVVGSGIVTPAGCSGSYSRPFRNATALARSPPASACLQLHRQTQKLREAFYFCRDGSLRRLADRREWLQPDRHRLRTRNTIPSANDLTIDRDHVTVESARDCLDAGVAQVGMYRAPVLMADEVLIVVREQPHERRLQFSYSRRRQPIAALPDYFVLERGFC